MTKQYFPLDNNEKKQEWVMRFFLAIFFLTILIGLYTQAHNIDFDGVLIPLLMFSIALFYLINGSNAFGKGNLVLKHTFPGLPLLLQFILKKWFSLPLQRARKITVLSFGIFSLLVGAICFFLGLLTVIKGV